MGVYHSKHHKHIIPPKRPDQNPRVEPEQGRRESQGEKDADDGQEEGYIALGRPRRVDDDGSRCHCWRHCCHDHTPHQTPISPCQRRSFDLTSDCSQQTGNGQQWREMSERRELGKGGQKRGYYKRSENRKDDRDILAFWVHVSRQPMSGSETEPTAGGGFRLRVCIPRLAFMYLGFGDDNGCSPSGSVCHSRQ